MAAHLVAAGTLVDDDPAEALAHARAARDRASRLAVVREAVGVAAYHAGDYAEAARELRAYRRMSGDEGYRAVLADCERALGRPEVALRLVREALDEGPDAAETVELRLVEAGARQDLGELPAARLVLEAALGGRPRPESVDLGDPATLRLAGAYADLLEAAGEAALAREWSEVVAAHTPEEPDVEFSEEELPGEEPTPAPEAIPEPQAAAELGAGSSTPPIPETDDDQEPVLEEDIEAEVAELLGEIDPPEDPGQH
ncbi:tetratricopeptide repeat protein [Geodermatophilus sp. SYSU D01105]